MAMPPCPGSRCQRRNGVVHTPLATCLQYSAQERPSPQSHASAAMPERLAGLPATMPCFSPNCFASRTNFSARLIGTRLHGVQWQCGTSPAQPPPHRSSHRRVSLLPNHKAPWHPRCTGIRFPSVSMTAKGARATARRPPSIPSCRDSQPDNHARRRSTRYDYVR